jgi:hypothetical protein
MAPAFQLYIVTADFGALAVPIGEAARGTRAAWRHGHFAPKFAPNHRISGRERKG